MRRWFEVYRDDEGAWFYAASDAGGIGNRIFVSMPHKQKLCDVFNVQKGVKFAVCIGDGDLTSCNGGDGTVPHLFVPTDGTQLKIGNAVDAQFLFIQGFYDKDLNQYPLFDFTFEPPDRTGA